MTEWYHGNKAYKFIENSPDHSYLVCGNYEYYHYMCDGFDDRGWGCGYRTLQSICSWINNNTDLNKPVPTIREIQTILVQLEDKPKSFLASKEWIGSFEVCLVLDHLYGISSKILHVNKGSDLAHVVDTLKDHFINYGCPVMMGGDIDNASKAIMGIHVTDTETYMLIMDPHYVIERLPKEVLEKKEWLKWQPLTDFTQNSFYNICLPQVKRTKLKQNKSK